ncbi:aspartate aminotransferase family protein [Uliginosibacterium sp. TH139]|uniref:aspartate aminotransferase family protein n=1 Tax=Uliginosibacterium sp. TH139 TaxID=2067453 RepID=UPI000C79727A|nr:aspartate aminotransferase family protein [Uliginosibacterium sp. TH139]PLK50400.1 aspartate aminotransferase family protein [Uliginosibacterium sp. TH139]
MNDPKQVPTQEAGVAGLDNSWLPFTPNRYFQAHPKLMASAKGAWYTNTEGQRLFDALSGLWCCPLGHAHAGIAEAISRQVLELDYSPAFQISNPLTLSLAKRIADLAPAGLDRVFFTNSGSEAVDTALKIAYGYQRLRGEGSRTRFIGREKAYHGVGFGGMSVGGMPANRKMFGPVMVPGVDHLPHTYNLSEMAFSKGMPKWGAHLADELERIVALHDASTIAAVIVEPIQGSVGVVVPPEGYLQKLREICTKHGILLIFDEVITGFGRMGTPFAAQFFGVTPDIICFAKGVTNGIIPMGGVIVREDIFQTFMGINAPQYAVELCHGFTYSGHPMAAAAGHAALDALTEGGAIAQAAALIPVLEEVIHSLKGEPGVIDIRNIGLAAAVDLQPIAGKPGARALKTFEAGIQEGVLLRFTADTIAMGPPFISTPDELRAMGDMLRRAIRIAMAD